MKKLLLNLLIIGALMLTSCGNHDIGFGSYSFHFVHIQMYHMTEPIHLRVSKWKGDDGGIELLTENYGGILLGDGTYMMYDTVKCPLCGEVEYK